MSYNFESSAGAQVAKIAHLKRLAGYSALLGLAIIASGWIIFWPGAGFDQGLPRLVILPSGLSANVQGYASPQALALSLGQLRLAKMILWAIVAWGFLPGLWRLVLRIGSTVADWRVKVPSKWFIAGALASIFTGLWPFSLTIWIIIYLKKLPGNGTKNRWPVGFILSAIMAIVFLSSLGSVGYYGSSTSLMDSGEAYRVTEASSNLLPELSRNYGNNQSLQGIMADQRAFVMAQNAWLLGDRRAEIGGLVAMQGHWMPKDQRSLARLAFLADDVWADLPETARLRLAPTAPYRSALQAKPKMRLGFSLAGLLAIGWAGLLFSVARRRKRFLDDCSATISSLRLVALTARAKTPAMALQP